MHTNFDDNEWCYRISLARPGCLRRSREALVLHHLTGRQALTQLHPGRDGTALAGGIR